MIICGWNTTTTFIFSLILHAISLAYVMQNLKKKDSLEFSKKEDIMIKKMITILVILSFFGLSTVYASGPEDDHSNQQGVDIAIIVALTVVAVVFLLSVIDHGPHGGHGGHGRYLQYGGQSEYDGPGGYPWR
jgi:hypothetical protein